jgi:purine-binding chemotaxis protein CheW
MDETRFGVFQVSAQLVGVPADRIHEMFILGDVKIPPRCPPYQRGAAVLRGNVYPAIDLRVCMGHVSARAEHEALVTQLSEREEDHRRWLAELEASVREDRPFGLAVDPRECRFGRWYYAFETDDPVLRGVLERFERPHAEIHALAAEVEALKAAGRREDAMRRIAETRTGLLAALLELFRLTRAAMREAHKEIGVTVELSGRRAVLVVDRAEAVADLEELSGDDDPLASAALTLDLFPRMARWRGSAAPVLVLDLARVERLSG